MKQKLQEQLANSASSAEIAVFFAGSDPLNAVHRRLVDWLELRNIEYTAVDIDTDEALASLKDRALAHGALPIICVHGQVAASGSLVTDLLDSGQLESLLSTHHAAKTPVIAVSPEALAVWQGARTEASDAIRLSVSASFEHSLSVDTPQPSDVSLTIKDVLLVMDPESAARADGIAIDWVKSGNTAGFRINNPNAVPNPRELDNEALERLLSAPIQPLIIDVRTEEEYQKERLPTSRHLDAALIDALAALDRHTQLFFYCDNGRRSRRAALHYVELGFTDVASLSGGLNAWKIHLANSKTIG
jgi:monothiol glutaredoxin